MLKEWMNVHDELPLFVPKSIPGDIFPKQDVMSSKQSPGLLLLSPGHLC